MKNYCKDCLHYNACKSMFIRGLDDYTAVRKLLMNYQEDMFDTEKYTLNEAGLSRILQHTTDDITFAVIGSQDKDTKR